jgi:hypothetical protein
MSSSPKYNWYRLHQEQERILREVRRQRAWQEAERRRIEQEARRADRLAHAQDVVSTDLTDAERRIAEVPEDVFKHVGPALAGVQTELRDCQNALWHCTWEGEAWRLRDRVRAVGRNLREILDEAYRTYSRVQAERLREERAREFARLTNDLALVEQRLLELTEPRRRRFDADGFTRVEAALDASRRALQGQNLQAAEERVERLRVLTKEHQARLEEAHKNWQTAFDAAQAQLAAVDEAGAGLRADEVVMRWCSRRVSEWEKALSQMKSLLSQDQFSKVESLARQILSTASAIVSGAQEQQLREEQRQYVADSLCQVLSGYGFLLSNDSPRARLSRLSKLRGHDPCSPDYRGSAGG